MQSIFVLLVFDHEVCIMEYNAQNIEVAAKNEVDDKMQTSVFEVFFLRSVRIYLMYLIHIHNNGFRVPDVVASCTFQALEKMAPTKKRVYVE